MQVQVCVRVPATGGGPSARRRLAILVARERKQLDRATSVRVHTGLVRSAEVLIAIAPGRGRASRRPPPDTSATDNSAPTRENGPSRRAIFNSLYWSFAFSSHEAGVARKRNVLPSLSC